MIVEITKKTKIKLDIEPHDISKLDEQESIAFAKQEECIEHSIEWWLYERYIDTIYRARSTIEDDEAEPYDFDCWEHDASAAEMEDNRNYVDEYIAGKWWHDAWDRFYDIDIDDEE